MATHTVKFSKPVSWTTDTHTGVVFKNTTTGETAAYPGEVSGPVYSADTDTIAYTVTWVTDPAWGDKVTFACPEGTYVDEDGKAVKGTASLTNCIDQDIGPKPTPNARWLNDTGSLDAELGDKGYTFERNSEATVEDYQPLVKSALIDEGRQQGLFRGFNTLPTTDIRIFSNPPSNKFSVDDLGGDRYRVTCLEASTLSFTQTDIIITGDKSGLQYGFKWVTGTPKTLNVFNGVSGVDSVLITPDFTDKVYGFVNDAANDSPFGTLGTGGAEELEVGDQLEVFGLQVENLTNESYQGLSPFTPVRLVEGDQELSDPEFDTPSAWDATYLTIAGGTCTIASTTGGAKSAETSPTPAIAGQLYRIDISCTELPGAASWTFGNRTCWDGALGVSTKYLTATNTDPLKINAFLTGGIFEYVRIYRLQVNPLFNGVSYYGQVPAFTIDANHVVTEAWGTPLVGDGILIEGTRENACRYSEDLSNPEWTTTNSTIGADSTTLGGVTLQEFDEGTVNAVHNVKRASNIPAVTSNASISFSAFVEYVGGIDKVHMRCDGALSHSVKFDIVSGEYIDASADTLDDYGIEQIQDNVYRVWMTYSGDSSTIANPHIHSLSAAGAFSYNGTDRVMNCGGFQIEDEASFPSSYIPTTTDAVERSLDVLSYSGTNVQDSEGSALATYTHIDWSTGDGDKVLSDDTGPHLLSNDYSNSGAAANDGTNTALGPVATPAGKTKAGVTWESTAMTVTASGSSGTAGTYDTAWGVDPLSIGLDWWGTIKDVKLYDTALTDAKMQELTQEEST